MKFITFLFVSVLLFVQLPAQQLTPTEKEMAEEYLNATYNLLEKTVENLTEEQLHYKPKNGGWTAMGCIEHLAIAEGYYLRELKKMIAENKVDMDKDLSHKDGFIYANISSREFKVKTSPSAEPKSRWKTKSEALAAIKSQRDEMLKILKNTNAPLRNLFFNHSYDEIDGYQIFIFDGAHMHTKQIKEVLAEQKEG